MTEFIYKVVYGVAAEAIAMVQHTLCECKLCSVVEAKETCLAETIRMDQHTICEGSVSDTVVEWLEDDLVARSDCLEDDNKFETV